LTELSFTSAYADDTGDKSSGTVVDKAFFEAIEDAINALIHSTANTGITPEDIIDEVVAARGNEADLDTRISGVIDDDGALVEQSNLISTSQLAAHQGFRNWVDDSRLEIWPDGDSSAPAKWALSGSGAAIARTGSGLGDTVNPSDWGGFAAKITYGSAAAKMTRIMVSSTELVTRLQGKTLVFGAWLRASAANQGSIVIDDGVTQTRGGESGSGTYHDGDSANAWCYGSHTVSATATKLDVYIECAVSGSVYVSAICVGLGNVVLTDWTPERCGLLVVGTQQRGDPLATGTTINEWRFEFPYDMGIFLRAKIKVKTAPTGQAIVYDVNNGGTSMYSTEPQVDATDTTNSPGDAPDGTYQYRCVEEDDIITFDCDQVGSSEPGEEATLGFLFKVPMGTFDLLEAVDL
jgi:hypothetical protein